MVDNDTLRFVRLSGYCLSFSAFFDATQLYNSPNHGEFLQQITMPPGKRHPGRPPKKIRKRGRQAWNDDLHIFNTTSSPPVESPPSAPITPPTESEAIITPRRRVYLNMIYEAHNVPPPDLSTNRSNKLLLLESIKHLAPVWKNIGHVLTIKLLDWFDAQVSHPPDSLSMCTLMKSCWLIVQWL